MVGENGGGSVAWVGALGGCKATGAELWCSVEVRFLTPPPEPFELVTVPWLKKMPPLV